ncbi:hypothetical protein [Natrinema sp. DC36]|uniref:hypothetical protein n=1 Tax=Natrinema sp. DC36 TaxID=2878680 RepID=UPI001CF05791|nr:hypothetical protein [Natrinema sp. DC36]
MAKLYWGLKRWQWLVIFLVAIWGGYLNTKGESSMPIVASILLTAPLYYILVRISVGAFRYLKYEYWDNPLYANPNKKQREEKYFTLVLSGLLLFVLSIASAFAIGAVTGPDNVDPDNPYNKETLVVGMNGSVSQNEEVAVKEAFEYWEGTSEKYAGYPIQYDFQLNEENPDVLVEWEDEIESCGERYDVDPAGCADLVSENYTVPEPVVIRIERRYSYGETIELLRHEVGHTLGLRHDDEPQRIMAVEEMRDRDS